MNNLVASTALTTTASSGSTGTTNNAGSWYYLIMLGILFLAMYFITIRPQNKKEKELKNLRDNLQLGDEVITIGGFYGTVVRINDDRITIASGSDKTKMEISKTAIASVLNREIPAPKKAAKEELAEESEEKVSPKKIKKLGKKAETEEEKPSEE